VPAIPLGETVIGTPPTRRPLDFLTQLDGIRFLAVGLVLIDHWLAERNVLPLGPLGVTIFFVLSGFLITRILLRSKDELLGESDGLGRYLKTFYMRRTLRIFPVYYLCLIVLGLANVPPVRETFTWCALYATNLYIAFKQTWMGSIDHFWSLAVEEQVYLFFPLLLFLVPRRWVPTTMVLMMIGSVGLRYVFFRLHLPWMVSYVSTPTCLDAFGLGALLAFGWLYRPVLFKGLFSSSLLVVGALAIYVALVAYSKTFAEVHNVYTEVWERLAASFLGAALIGRATTGFTGPFRYFLENQISRYLGQISYGLYLFHNLVYNPYHSPKDHPTLLVWNALTGWMPFLETNLVLKICYFFGLTIALASLSWYVLEKPINKLKSRFSY